MKEVAYQILTHLPIIGVWYRNRLEPKLPSDVLRALHKDGAMDRYLKAVDDYKKQHPGEAIIQEVVNRLIRDSGITFDD